MTELILSILFAYLIGSIPFALVVGRLFFQTDVRQHGSGNLGATNTFRVLGKKAGFAVTLLDMLKGGIALYIPLLFGSEIHPLICGAAAVFGHVFPIFARFKGGKAVATSAGMLLFYNPLVFLLLAVSFFGTMYFSKYVSLSSIITAVVAVITTFFTFATVSVAGILIYRESDFLYTIIIVILAILLIFKHRTNISRILNGTEPKIKWM